MATTETGTYRVFEGDRDAEEWLLVDRETEEPVYVAATGYDESLQARVEALEPGNLVTAELDWTDPDGPQFSDLTVESRTLFAFVDGTSDIFEQAQETFEQGRREQMPIASETTYDNDGQENGALYTIAKQQDERNVFADLATGRMTLEPMIAKLREGGADPPYEVFVIRPTTAPFVVVFLTLERGGLLANTIREEYDCPR